ncbi:MAG: response regulator, partial [Desulfobacterales bacterium]|nr:response regulator [Desulfobacterales bacterium]
QEVQPARKVPQENPDSAIRPKSEFQANMGHERRPPLNAVTGFSELLTSIVTDKKQKSYLKAIKTGGKSLLTLINDILDLSKIEAGRMEIQYASVNPLMIFNEIEQIFRIKIIAKNIQFIMDVDPSLPTALMLDETRLRQILLNIVGNAVKFTRKGSVRLTARAIYKTDAPSVIDLALAVEDTGRGISEKEQETIFQPFRQQDGQDIRKYGGAGLGLAISKNLIELMNGEITVRSAPGGGAVFEILLRDVKMAKPGEIHAVEETFDIENIAFKKSKVLVVDDVESNRDYIFELLTRANLDVLTAENGQESIIMAGEYQPDVILMDIRMPVMNGIEATRLLKNYPETREIPVLALTASAKVIDASDFADIGLDGYLSKPVAASDLFFELSRWLDHTKKDAVKDAEPPEEASESPVVGDVEQLPRLCRTLKAEIIPAVQKLKGVIRITEVTSLRKRIDELAEEYNAPALIDYADRLQEVERSYNIAEIEKTLSELPRIVKKFEKTNGE